MGPNISNVVLLDVRYMEFGPSLDCFAVVGNVVVAVIRPLMDG